MEYVLYLVIVMQFLVIGLLIHIQANERKDLYNRIMAKDLPEYKAIGAQPSKPGNFIKSAIARQNKARKEM